MDKYAKLRPLYLAKILYERTDDEHFLTTSQLCAILEKEYNMPTHRQTLKGDIDLLTDFGLDIQEVKSTQNRYNLLGRSFDLAELKLLIDAVVSSKFITKKKSEGLTAKLCSLAGNYGAARLKRNVSVEGRIKTENEKIYLIIDTINEAINKNKKISFQYFKYDTSKARQLKKGGKPFVITPLHLIWNGDYYYMLGVYDYKQKLGSFRIDRIARRPEILEETGTPAPADFDLNTHLSTTFRMYGSEHCEVSLLCDNGVIDSIIDRFGHDVQIKSADGEHFIATAEVAVSHIFFGWIFGFGGRVEILSPESAKEQYREMLSAAAEKENNR